MIDLVERCSLRGLYRKPSVLAPLFITSYLYWEVDMGNSTRPLIKWGTNSVKCLYSDQGGYMIRHSTRCGERLLSDSR
jgi:hypothetical protein